MSHSFSLRSIRFVGYFLTKIMKSIYGSVYVSNNLTINSNSIYFSNNTSSLSETINQLSRESPILYMPTHRSYADFLIFSFVCFSLDLPLPSIAAGIDFLALNQIASLLRSCGAFYIRRSFKHLNDNIYWHVFRAYVQSQVRGGERPLEFFIEGTRSRSGKSLYPRTGLLSVALELYLTGQIPDLLIIPVSMSYDRVLEEGLYAKELLPSIDYKGKPPETTKHLLSGANAILSQNFGSVYIRFCEPISIRELCDRQDLRLEHTLDSKCDPNRTQSQSELDFIMDLSKLVIKSHQMNFILSPFTYASLIFLTYFDDKEQNEVSIPMSILLEDSESLSSLLNYRNLSTSITNKSFEAELKDSLEVHSNIVKISEDKTAVIINTSDPLIRVHYQQYANQSMQLLIDLACFLYSNGEINKFNRIKWFLSREFIYKESELNDCYVLAQFMSQMSSNERIQKSLIFQIDYYINNYLQIAQWLTKYFSSQQNPIDIKSLVKAIQIDLMICSDLVQNCLSILLKSNALLKDSNNQFIAINYNMHNLIIELNQLSHSQNYQYLNSFNFKLKANL